MNDRELFLNEVMYNFGKEIYKNLFDLCELEKSGKKNEKSYFLILKDLKRLLDLENGFYRTNMEEIYKSRGFLSYLIAKRYSDENNGMFEYLSSFNEEAINERIKSKLKQYIGIEKMINGSKYYNRRLNFAESHDISNAYLDDMFLTDMQKVSMIYMEKAYPNDRAIDYKYLTSLIFNVDNEMVRNYFIVNPEIQINSSLLYYLEGFYKECYIMDLVGILSKKFDEFVDYIILVDGSLDDDSDYKIDIALGYLKSILDLIPKDIEEDFKNDFMLEFSNDFSVSNHLKTRILESVNESGYARRLINYVTMGDYNDWY